jgi:hypothetical protein
MRECRDIQTVDARDVFRIAVSLRTIATRRESAELSTVV